MTEEQTELKTGAQGQWATPVERLSVPALPKEAINLNVQGLSLIHI